MSVIKKGQLKTNYQLARGLNLYLPSDQARKWERTHGTENRTVSINLPLSMLQSLFDTLGAMTADDMGVLMGRWAGMTPHIATIINKDLTSFYSMLTSKGMRHAFRQMAEPKSWALSRERGWAETK